MAKLILPFFDAENILGLFRIHSDPKAVISWQWSVSLTEEEFGGSLHVPVASGESNYSLALLDTDVGEVLGLLLEDRVVARPPGVDVRPLLGRQPEHVEVVLVLLGHHRVLRVVRLRGRHERLQRQKHRAQRHGGRPLVLQDVQTNGTRHRRDVRVPDLCYEFNLQPNKQTQYR